MKASRVEIARVERHPESDMIMIVLEDGGRMLLVRENERYAIAAAGPGRETWAPTWYAFDVEGPGLDFNGVPGTLEAAVDARGKLREREPVRRLVTHPDSRSPAWWREKGRRARLEGMRFRGEALGRPPCLCAQLLDRGHGIPFAASCLRDGKPRLIAERGCRLIASRKPEIGRRSASRTARGIERIINEAPHAATLFRQATVDEAVWLALKRDVRKKLNDAGVGRSA